MRYARQPLPKALLTRAREGGPRWATALAGSFRHRSPYGDKAAQNPATLPGFPLSGDRMKLTPG